MDSYRSGDRYGPRHDLGLLAMFLLPLVLIGGIVAVVTAGTLWEPPDIGGIFGSDRPASSMFGNSQSGVAVAGTPTPDSQGVAAGPTVEPTAPPATATPEPTPTVASAQAYVIGNTGGDGAWLRRTPRINDYLIAWPDNTLMVTAGPDVEAEGRLWRHVTDPRGNRGYIPAEWLIPVEP